MDMVLKYIEQCLDFSRILNLSISASWMILAVIAVRFAFKNLPKWIRVMLWGFVGIRLLLPFSFESAFSLIPSTQTVPQKVLQFEGAQLSQNAYIDIVTNPIFPQDISAPIGQTVDRMQINMINMTFIWIVGIVILLVYTAVSYWRLKHKLNTAILYKDNIFYSENIDTPFVLGLIKPKIYIPFSLQNQNSENVIMHEQSHIIRKDHWWKLLGFLLLTIHWFNPIIWTAYILLCIDIEFACDEKVIRQLDNEQKANYTQSLVECSINRKIISACPIAFGEIGVKERVKAVMNYKKPAFWVVILGAVVCVVIAAGFLTNPISYGDYFSLADSESPANQNRLLYEINIGDSVKSGKIYVEQWVDGNCVKSSPVNMTKYADSIEILMSERYENNVSVGTDVQIETNQYGGSLITYFPYPENLNIVGWGFNGYELDEKVKISADEEVILAAKVFDTGEGVRIFTCETLINDPERIQNANCMIVVRAVFSSDDMGVSGQEQTSSPIIEIPNPNETVHHGLNAEIVEIDENNNILYVKDIDESADIFGDRCAVDCRYAISRYNLLYVDYGSADNVIDIEFNEFKVGDEIIIALTETNKQNILSNNYTVANQIQLSTQRLDVYSTTPQDQTEEKYSNEDFVIAKSHYKNFQGLWVCEGYRYKYRLEITGKMNNSEKNMSYIVLSNTEDINFEQTMKASGISSNTADYFDPETAVIAGHKIYS